MKLAKKEENGFDFIESLAKIEDWDWKKEAFKRYVTGLNIEIKSEKELIKKYKDYYGGE